MRLRAQALGIGAVLTALQLSLALSLAPGRGVEDRYLRLCTWDCLWYEKIAHNGYQTTWPPVRQNWDVSNVAFFPAYPYLARALYLGTGLSPKLGLLLVAQVLSVFFWAALWMLLQRWRIQPGLAALVVFAVLAHPAAFYLIAGYSESLFLATLVGYLMISQRQGRGAARRAAVAGVAMTGTRIIGVLAAGFPVMYRLSRGSPRGLGRALGLAAVAVLGALAFFAYCALRFGHFNLYLETQRLGWGIVPDYGALWKWGSFRYRMPLDAVGTRLSGAAFLLCLSFEAFSAGLCRSSPRALATGFRRRLPVYATAFLIFFITLSGLKSVGFQSMIRYTLPWFILLLVCIAHLLSRLTRSVPLPLWLRRTAFCGALAALVALAYYQQLPHLVDFLNGRWFA